MIILVKFEAVGLGDSFRSKHFFWRTICDDSLVKEESPGEVNRQNSQIVSADDNGFSFGGEAFKGVKNQFLCGDVIVI